MADRELARWQVRMAPLMAALVVSTAIFFAIVSLVEFQRLQAALSSPPPQPEQVWPAQVTTSSYAEQLDLSFAKASFALERELIARRYQQASFAVIGRVWTRFMGFTTGMLLALVGAAFVLGRLQVPATEIEGSGETAGQKLTLSLRSASPGLVLAVLGTLLMSMSIIVPTRAETTDIPVYFGTLRAESPPTPALDAAQLAGPYPTTQDHAKSAPP